MKTMQKHSDHMAQQAMWSVGIAFIAITLAALILRLLQ